MKKTDGNTICEFQQLCCARSTSVGLTYSGNLECKSLKMLNNHCTELRSLKVMDEEALEKEIVDKKRIWLHKV